MTSDESSDLIAIKSSKMLNYVCYFVHYNLDEKYWTNEACLLLSLMLFMKPETRLYALLMAKFTYLVGYSFRKVYFQSRTLVLGICLAR